MSWLERLAVPLQQRQAGVHQPQLEVLAQEEGVARREQRRIGPVDALDADQALQLRHSSPSSFSL
jgi:hypothetical protein